VPRLHPRLALHASGAQWKKTLPPQPPARLAAQPPPSQQGSSGIIGWGLSWARDRAGNEYSVTWGNFSGVAAPAYINFTGNAAVGGWSGFAFPNLPEPIGAYRGNAALRPPYTRPSLAFVGNTAHSSSIGFRIYPNYAPSQLPCGGGGDAPQYFFNTTMYANNRGMFHKRANSCVGGAEVL
jgi:hypothetical protein